MSREREAGTRALLLAAGIGSRLRPLTDHTPKCLVEVAGRPLLDYWFGALAPTGIRDVLINTHHLPERVHEYLRTAPATQGFRIEESYEPELLGSAGTLSANREWVDGAEACLIVYVDNLSSVDLGEVLDFHRSHPDPVSVVLFRTERPKECGIVDLDQEGRIVKFQEKPERPLSDLANGGIYVVDAPVYREMADMRAFDLGGDVLPALVGQMRGWIFEGYHRDIGTPESLERAREDAPRVFGSRGLEGG